jgi:tetratricopeptide (TPR) repeat protein/predicted Ser/Thr protein kinase
LAGALESGGNESEVRSLSLHDIAPPGQKVACIGDYELQEVIARGGMGVVYQARQRSMNRGVALKLLLGGAHAEEGYKRRFRQEAETAGRLQHPNIVPIYEVGEHDGQSFFSMERVAGTDLAQLTRHQPLPAKSAAQYLKTVAEAVQYAHEQGVLHRDLKPSNILIGPDDRPRITDFGLARLADSDSSLTASGQTLGTPSYLPPEQASLRHGLVGVRSDVYGLGATLYHLLTGRPPFLAGTIADTLKQVLEVDPVPPRVMNPAIPPDLETVCLKCLQKDPAHRYASAQALAEDLSRWLRGEPILAKPAAIPERAAKWARRHPAVAMLIATLALATLISTGLVFWARAERDRAIEAERRTKTVLGFFQDKVLTAARPAGKEGGLGHNATLRTAISNAEPSIAESFANQPQVEAAIRGVMGLTYVYLKEPTNAVRQLERAYALQKSELGEDHPDTLTTMAGLAQAHATGGGYEQALDICQRIFHLAQTRFGPEHPHTLAAMNNLAIALARVGRLDDAIPIQEKVMSIRKAKFDPTDAEMLAPMNNLGWFYADAGRSEEATRIQEMVLALSRKSLGTEHPDTILAMNNLAGSYADAGRYGEAVELLEQTVKMTQDKLGLDHPDALTAIENLAVTYAEVGVTKRAIPLLEQALERKKAVLGEEHPDTLGTMNSLGNAYHAAGDYEQALVLQQRTLGLRQARLDTNDPATLATLSALARTHRARGELQPALGLWEEVLRRGAGQPAGSDLKGLEAMRCLVLSYRDVGRDSEAQLLRERVLALKKAGLSADLSARPRIRPALGKAVDLAVGFDAGLSENWLDPRNRGENLSLLPRGLLNLTGVSFDICGIVQLQGKALMSVRPEFPERVEGLAVGQKARRAHFLHGAAGAGPQGTTIARYVVHYGDGKQQEVPVSYGVEVLDWRQTTNQEPSSLSGATVAWQGTLPRWAKEPGKCIRLYRMTWDNPRPEVEVERLDFVSAIEDAAPFLLAITVE